jgi:hypothetical protein
MLTKSIQPFFIHVLFHLLNRDLLSKLASKIIHHNQLFYPTY